VLDLVNTFELSRSLLRVIERRIWLDGVLVYAGMVIIIIVLILVWYFFT